MQPRSPFRWPTLLASLATIALIAGLLAAAAVPAGAQTAEERVLVRAKTAASYSALKAKAVADGATVIRDLPQLRTMVVLASAGQKAKLAADTRTAGVATDHVITVAPPNEGAGAARIAARQAPGLRSAKKVKLPAARAKAPAAAVLDPAFDYKGLMWNETRVGIPQAWKKTKGSPKITVGVADTGLDFTHHELAPKVTEVIDLTRTEGVSACGDVTDEDLAAEFGGPVTTDWNGHGSWIGGNIAGALDGTGMNGIAPGVGLVALKISEWCGSAFDSALLTAFVTAADKGIDVVSISFGGYVDRRDPEQELLWQAYVDAVAYAKRKGTVIAASSGNEHVRIGADGKVLSPTWLLAPGEEFVDLTGSYEAPGGVPGVVNVSATNRVVNKPSATCSPGSEGSPENLNAVCKPATDPHQPIGVGRQDQLAYYSNYGPGIDIAAPGGARKFNLPAWDRGGTPGFPVTGDDLTNAWQTFSITSNWATGIPCYTFAEGSGFPPDQCYSTIQGTSMATPHVSAALALTASAHPSLRKKVDRLVNRVKSKAQSARNTTPGLSATDTSPGDLNGVACPTGYCHLGGPRISNREAYGAGIVYVAKP
jgi:lantibiotic leader peptide-processing serine protease